MHKRLPKFIKLGSLTYKIVRHRKSTKDLGETNFNSRQIHLWKQESCELPNTLLHECIHVVLEDVIQSIMSDKKSVDDFEEDLVRLVTPRFLSLLRENPELLSYLLRE